MTNLSDISREFLLASLATGYPDPELVELLAEPEGKLCGHEGLGGMTKVAATGIDALRAIYIDLFDRGKGRVSLYETEYGRMRGLGKGNDLADISGFYRAFSLALEDEDEAVRELYDHVSVELEFYASLVLRQQILVDRGDQEGCEIVEDARRKFLADHLGRFVGAIASQPSVRASEAYGPVFAWCERLVGEECARLDVSPAPLDFFADDGERDEAAACGAVRLPVVD
jgi:nitrate reductase assembly molybdenum cofactor insertion protein NarJ